MMTVKEILDAKGRQVWTIAPEAKVIEALRIMAEQEVGALVVVAHDLVVGVISERDYARKIILAGRVSRDSPVGDIMTSPVYGVGLQATTEECMGLMTGKRIRHLPVCENDKLLGVVSIGDIVKSIMTEQKIAIEDLTNYIMGKYV